MSHCVTALDTWRDVCASVLTWLSGHEIVIDFYHRDMGIYHHYHRALFHLFFILLHALFIKQISSLGMQVYQFLEKADIQGQVF